MKMRHTTKKTALAIAMVAAFGVLRVPLEDRLQARMEADELLVKPLGIGMLDQMGQSAFLATLGGTRSLVAIYMTLLAYDAWQFKEWEKVENFYDIVYQLDPLDIEARVVGAWHQAYNASIDMEQRPDWRQYKLPGETSREQVVARYARKGADILRAGIENNPDSGKLYQELGWTLWDRVDDPCAAAAAYERAMNLPGSLGFTVRFYGYALAECPGREEQAFDYLMGLYREGDKHKTPSLIKAIKRLEALLDIPILLRIPDPDPDERLRRQFETEDSSLSLPLSP